MIMIIVPLRVVLQHEHDHRKISEGYIKQRLDLNHEVDETRAIKFDQRKRVMKHDQVKNLLKHHRQTMTGIVWSRM